jgi:hypothetical protein
MRAIPFLLSISLISLLGCGKKFDGLTSKKQKFAITTNPSIFQSEVAEFIKAENLVNPNKNLQNLTADYQATLLMQSIPINLYDLTIDYKAEKYIGVCNTDPKTGKKEILIDTATWNAHPDWRTVLILHELGHCWPGVLRGHYTTVGNCRSIMEAKLISSTTYAQYKEYLQYELFNKLSELKKIKPNTTAPCAF